MVQQIQTRKPRHASPERWQKAAQRAIAVHIEVWQVNENGMWVATSGSDPKVAYLLEIRNAVVTCSCPAGEFGDPCCKHAAKFYLDAGLLDPEPEPRLRPRRSSASAAGEARSAARSARAPAWLRWWPRRRRSWPTPSDSPLRLPHAGRCPYGSVGRPPRRREA
jgi:hypothetical protein